MNSWSWKGGTNLNPLMEVADKTEHADIKATTSGEPCVSTGHRRCSDGSCIARVDLCPEEQMMNQNAILILIVVGMAVVLFLILLYCFQQRTQRTEQQTTATQGTFESIAGDGDNSSLNLPPPTYAEAVDTSAYPPTLVFQRNTRISSSAEPRTPPPNYDAALTILAENHDVVLPVKAEPKSPLVRRSVSSDFSACPRQTRSSLSSEVEFRRLFSSQDHR